MEILDYEYSGTDPSQSGSDYGSLGEIASITDSEIARRFEWRDGRRFSVLYFHMLNL
jgi:hypothetical protein